MSIVNFSIPIALDRRIKEVVKQKGIASRAEFFRFASLVFLDVVERPITSEAERFKYLTKNLSQEIISRYRQKKLPSLKEQLADL